MEEQNREKRARKKAAMKRRRMIFFSCLAILVVAAGIGLTSLFLNGEGTESGGKPGDGGILGGKPKEDTPVQLTISCVGDVMVHKSQLTAQYDASSKTYKFDDNFQHVKKYIDAADLALCNVETTFAGGSYSGYPAFNSPETLADALKNAGFDVAITSNNHMMDTGFKGMQRTIEILRGAGFPVTGSRLSGETQRYVMEEVNGVKVAVTGFTYETPGVNGRRTINSAVLSDEAKELVNSFSYNSLDNDLALFKETIDAARADGADLVITYFHFGEEYQRSPNDWQQSIARKAAEMGADAIFASHPHVLQGVEMLELPRGNVPVFYSMGNFISNQRMETLDNRYTEQGMIANVHFTYMKESKKITDVSMDAVPVWVDKYNSGGKTHYALVPLDADLQNNEALKTSGHLSRAQQALADVKELLGEQYVAQ